MASVPSAYPFGISRTRRWPAPRSTPRPRTAPPLSLVQASPPLPELAEDREPNAVWRAAGLRFLEEAEAALWSTEGERARAYLHGRGLKDEPLRACRNGFPRQEGRR